MSADVWSPAIQSVFLDNRDLSLSRESLGLITTTLDNVLSRVLRETFRNEARSVSANVVDQQRQPQLIYDTMLSLMPIELLDDCQPQPQQAQQQQPTFSISVENSPFMFSQSLVKQRLQDGLIDIDENLVEVRLFCVCLLLFDLLIWRNFVIFEKKTNSLFMKSA